MENAGQRERLVDCYAGSSYPDRPLAFTWKGQKRQVAEVEKEWREPGMRVFVVKDTSGGRFQLAYEEQTDMWKLDELG